MYRGAPRRVLQAAERVFFAAARGGLLETGFHPALRSIVHWRSRWIRQPSEWRPTSAEGGLLSLLEWVFVEYPVPAYFAGPFFRCGAGRAAVMAFQPRSGAKVERLTVHVDLDRPSVVEVRGLQIRFPTSTELGLVKAWAKEVNVSVGSWALSVNV